MAYAEVGRVVVIMDYFARDGLPWILGRCTLPLAGQAVVNRIITNLALIDVTPNGLRLVECAAGVDVRHVRQHRGAELHLA